MVAVKDVRDILWTNQPTERPSELLVAANKYHNHIQQKRLQEDSIYVASVLTSNDVAIAVLIAVFVLLSRFPGCRLSLRQGLDIHMHTHTHTQAQQ